MVKGKKFKDDPLFSVIVPVYDVPLDVFKRCLMSIADQDYPNLEVILVPNGGDKEAEKMAREFSQGRSTWNVFPTEEKGACNARNLGFKHSKGEIVSFTNSDYILNTGIIRTWVDALLAHPECGFAYGAYEYASSHQEVYWSKPFDIEQLRTANYIDCGFPVWRQHVAQWDPSVKSLQDWDFWLSVVEKGVKGHFLDREISFVAAPPRPKGLSMDSSSNWEERVMFIKEKHGIKDRDICVTSIGAPFHGMKIAQMIEADYRDDTLFKPHSYKALYLIGWYMKPKQEHNAHSTVVNYFVNSKVIVHFVGADIFWLRKFSTEFIKGWAGAMKLATHHILCENEAAQEELKGYGIDAEIVPIPPYTNLDVKPLPKEFSVALYLTDKSDFDKYVLKYTLSIVKAMPDVKFVGYGDAQLGEFKAKNFEHKGNLTTEEWGQFVYDRSANLRLVKHDTRPMASDEFIIAGRSVITNIPNECHDVVDTSGNFTFDKWDKFAPGFSARRWPATKKAIIKKIREVRNEQKSEAFELLRLSRSVETKSVLDKEKYIEKIRSLATSPILEVLHA